MSDHDFQAELIHSVEDAIEHKQPLAIHGSNSKNFLGNKITGKPVDVSHHNGIIEYEPSELFITAKCGTPLQEIESTLRENKQILPFEPPSFAITDTLGGTIACGLSGPRRAYANSIRDCILGANIINGKAEYLTFGGNVMKNVAGYDTSRLMCGAYGTLGIIMQASIRVAPKPQFQMTTVLECSQNEAITQLGQWAHTHLPITASFFHNNLLHIRLEGLQNSVINTHKITGGEVLSSNEEFWNSVKNHRHEFFKSELPLWKLVIPHNTPALPIPGNTCFEWNSGLRWITSNDSPENIISCCKQARGSATLFKSTTKPNDHLPDLSADLKKLHIKIKSAFDPDNIFNPGRQYSWC